MSEARMIEIETDRGKVFIRSDRIDAMECAHANTGRIGIAHVQDFGETGQLYGESRREPL